MVGAHGACPWSLVPPAVLVLGRGYTQSQEIPQHSGALTRTEHTLPMENPGVEPSHPCSELPIHVILQDSPCALWARKRAQYSVFSSCCAELVCSSLAVPIGVLPAAL